MNMKRKVFGLYDRIRTNHMRHVFYKRDLWMIEKLNLPHLTNGEIKQIKEVWPFVDVKENDLIWPRVYKQEYGFDPYFITDYHLLYILRKTNPHSQVVSLENKAMFDVYFSEIPFPTNYLKCIHGTYWANGKNIGEKEAEDLILSLNDVKLVAKPTIDTGCGKGVKIDEKHIIVQGVKNHSFGSDFVIQEVLSQHPTLSVLNPSSVNSCRVTTILLNEKFSWSTILKIGKKNSYVDNWNSGYLIGVDKEGSVLDKGYDSFLKPVTKSDCDINFAGLKLPVHNEMINSLKRWHMKYFPQVGIVGWDVLIDSLNRIKVIEVNLKTPGVVGEQFCSGTFFKYHHDAIIGLF